MVKIISKLMNENGIYVRNVEELQNNNSFGLLHEPIRKFLIYTDTKEIQLAVKKESLVYPPELLFKDLYIECSKKNQSTIHLEWFDKCCNYLSIKDMPQRELYFYNNVKEKIDEYTPKLWIAFDDDSSQTIIMDDMSNCVNIDKINYPDLWNISYLKIAVSNLAIVHSRLLKTKLPISNCFDYDDTLPFLKEFHSIISNNCGITLNNTVFNQGNKFIDNIIYYETFLRDTSIVIHNDFNIRNICICPQTFNLKIYDWEFITLGNPMIDIIDLLLSINTNFINKTNIDILLKTYCEKYYNLTGNYFSLRKALKMLYVSALKFAATRMNMYLLCYMNNKYSYIERMYSNLSIVLDFYNSIMELD